MEFNPNNPILQLCIQGMKKEAKGMTDEAGNFFDQAWHEAADDFEKFIAAHFVGRHKTNAWEKLHWCEIALQYALQANDVAIQSALPTLYTNIAKCYEDLGKPEKAQKSFALAESFIQQPLDPGPFYHGTKAQLTIGDELIAGRTSNYNPDIIMNHIYFTASANGAGLAAALAKGDGPDRVYQVEPTGSFENDPNLTDQKFPGNLTRSYRTDAPLKILGQITDWKKQTSDELQKWHKRLADSKEDIIN